MPLTTKPPLPGFLRYPISNCYLEYLSLIYHLLYCISGDEAVDGDSIFLSEAQSMLLRLSICLRFPIWVIKDDSISSVQVLQNV